VSIHLLLRLVPRALHHLSPRVILAPRSSHISFIPSVHPRACHRRRSYNNSDRNSLRPHSRLHNLSSPTRPIRINCHPRPSPTAIPFATNSDTCNPRDPVNSFSLRRLIIPYARITHDRTERSRYSKRPTSGNSAELMPCSEIDNFLAQRHALPSRLHAVFNERDLVRISSFPAHM
jgi:hypothetical protein